MILRTLRGRSAHLLAGRFGQWRGRPGNFSRTDAIGPRHFLTDALRSTLGLSTASGTLLTQYTYEPSGRTSTSGATNANPYQYTGRESDGTGLYYYRARYYSPTLQRFIGEDPLEFAAGDVDLYAYTGNSPPNFSDPFGLVTIDKNFSPDCLPTLDRAAQIVRRTANKNPQCNCAFRKIGTHRSLKELFDDPQKTVHFDPKDLYSEGAPAIASTEVGNTQDIWVHPLAAC